MEETAGKQLLDVQGLMEMGYSKSQAQRLLKAPGMPVLRVGGAAYMHRELLLKKMQECAETGRNMLPPVKRKPPHRAQAK